MSTPSHVREAPLKRAHLDRAAPWLRLLAGLVLLSYTSVTTIRGFGEDFAPLLEGELWGLISVRLVAGVLAAVAISVGQWITSDKWVLLYASLLWVDARYTQRQIGPGVERLVAYHLEGVDKNLHTVVSFVVSWSSAILAARYGEILLFGKRGKPPARE